MDYIKDYTVYSNQNNDSLELLLTTLDSKRSYSDLKNILENIINNNKYINTHFVIKTYEKENVVLYYCIGKIICNNTELYIVKNSFTKEWKFLKSLPEAYLKLTFQNFTCDIYNTVNIILDNFERCYSINLLKLCIDGVAKNLKENRFNMLLTIAMCRFGVVVTEVLNESYHTKYDFLFVINRYLIGYNCSNYNIIVQYLYDICTENGNSEYKCTKCYKYYCPLSGIKIYKKPSLLLKIYDYIFKIICNFKNIK